ncbi:hypothetical protein C9I98_03160 [Photobacterium sanctipauli]|uniref:Uncharacterized protein n=1 Tax=Photobacterium sanctipauli TaxID=1342794 RepID=A0A2T3P178_9GAMM|nr:DUF6559 family protein [Photobacterium sanctipauli]PSW22276.1 hypothetical protein C9I98_03160 [Photobacterium sanctipauli]
MMLFSKLRRKRALRAYISKLAPVLVADYGPQESFSLGQIEQAAKKTKVSKHFFRYAIALYLEQATEQTQQRYQLDQTELNALRQTLSTLIFGGEPYQVKDILALTTSSGWKGGSNRDNLSNYYGQNSRY